MRIWPPGYCKVRWDNFAFEAMEAAFCNFPAYAKLSLRSQARLYLHLCKARAFFGIGNDEQNEPRHSAVASEIKGVLGSIKRVASFGRRADSADSRIHEAAMRFMSEAGEDWAASQPKDRLPSMFQPSSSTSNGSDRTDYGTWPVILRFFETAPLVAQFARMAEKALRESEQGELGLTEIQWLAGEKLPEIYSRVFKSSFTITLSADGSTASAGINFVITALNAIGVRPKGGDSFMPNTIKTHCRAAKKASQVRRR